MKKSTKKLTLTLVAVLVFVLCIGVLVACDLVPSNPSHTHSYSENWKSDKDNHWKECACGDKSEEAAHVNEQGDDELCDVCGYDLHVHSYGTAWKSDKDNHWKECSCGDKSELAAHVDANNDEKCDVCEYDSHVHSYDSWAFDDTDHWKECATDHAKDDSTKAAHSDPAYDGVCDTCGYDKMHKHAYNLWDKDADNHWQKCSCGAILTSSTAPHADTDNDELCDDCGKDMHVHSYTEWAWNDTEHWKACPKDDAADATSYADHEEDYWNPGYCEICGGHFICIDDDSDGICDIEDCAKHCAHVDHNGDFVCDIEDCGEELESHTHSMRFVLPIDEMWGDEITPTPSKDVEGAFACTNDGDDVHHYCKMEPITVKYCPLGSEAKTTVEDGKCVYYYLAPDYDIIYNLPTQVDITIGATTTLERIYYTAVDDDYNLIINNTVTALSAGKQALGEGDISTVLYKATATDGNVSFKIDYLPGESQTSAIEIEKNKLYEGKDELWLKYTATEDEELVFFNTALSCEYDEEIDMLLEDYPYCMIFEGLDDEEGLMCAGKYTIVSIEKDTVYYIYIPEMYDDETQYGVKLMDKVDGESYLGYAMTSPAPIDGNTLTVSTDANGTRYYTWTASENGTLDVAISSETEGAYSLVTCMAPFTDAYGTSWSYPDDENTIAKGETWLIIVEYYAEGNNGDYTLTFSLTPDTTGGEGSGTEGGDEGDEGGSTFAFPTDLIGTWYIEDGTKIVISANSLSMDGAECIGYAIDDSGDVTHYNFQGMVLRYTIYKDGDTWKFGTYESGHLTTQSLLTTDPSGEASGSIPEVFYGTWSGEFDIDEDEPWLMTITITADSISVDETSLTGEDIEINGMQITIVGIATLTYNAEDDTLLVDKEGVTAIFTKDSTGTTASLDLGDNEVSATAEGVAMTFTSEAGGSYVLSTADENAYIGSNAELEFAADLYTPYHFTLAAGESKTFYFSTNDTKDDTYIITIAQAEA